MTFISDTLDARRLVVFDGTAWYVRRVRTITHDGERNEMVYRCDRHLGGPFTVLDDAIRCLERLKSST